MTDPHDPHDFLDDHLRAALEDEAAGIEADEALLDRIRTAEVAAPKPRRLPVWAAAAVLALVAGTVAVVSQQDDDEVRVTPPANEQPYTPEEAFAILAGAACDGDPDTITVWMAPRADEGDLSTVQSMSEVAPGRLSSRYDSNQQVLDELTAVAPDPGRVEGVQLGDVPSRYVVTVAEGTSRGIEGGFAAAPGVVAVTWPPCDGSDSSTTTTVPPETPLNRPVVVALVREDGTLVVVDLPTGETTELVQYDDPTVSTTIEGGPYTVDSVDLAPDVDYVYFSTCCEPAIGITYRIPVTGGEPVQVAQGHSPRVSPDGRYVATASDQQVVITPVPGVEGEPVTFETAGYPGRLAWSPDGTELAFRLANGDSAAQIQSVRWDGTTMTALDPGKPDNPGEFAIFSPDGILTIESGAPLEDDRSWSTNRSATWVLVVDGDGTVKGFESPSGESEVLDLPPALAADW